MSTVVLSVGGSVLCPDRFDTQYALALLKTLHICIPKTSQIIIVCGGGSTARKYIQDVQEHLNTPAKDRIGISITKVHAQCIFELAKTAHIQTQLVRSPQKATHRLTILGGTTPGHSTDYVAMQAAIINNASLIINISNTPAIFDQDPSSDKAMPLTQITWKELQTIVGNKFNSGYHAPFDPVAVSLATKTSVAGIFIGKDIAYVQTFLKDNVVIGTVVL